MTVRTYAAVVLATTAAFGVVLTAPVVVASWALIITLAGIAVAITVLATKGLR